MSPLEAVVLGLGVALLATLTLALARELGASGEPRWWALFVVVPGILPVWFALRSLNDPSMDRGAAQSRRGL
jgi:hypothetical protein